MADGDASAEERSFVQVDGTTRKVKLGHFELMETLGNVTLACVCVCFSCSPRPWTNQRRHGDVWPRVPDQGEGDTDAVLCDESAEKGRGGAAQAGRAHQL